MVYRARYCWCIYVCVHCVVIGILVKISFTAHATVYDDNGLLECIITIGFFLGTIHDIIVQVIFHLHHTNGTGCARGVFARGVCVF